MSSKIAHRLILLAFGMLGLGWSVLMPIWEAPDEPQHYAFALHIAREGSVPTMRDTYEARQPPVYYWLAGRVVIVLDAIDPSLADSAGPRPERFGRVPRYRWNRDNYRFLPGPQLLRWGNLLLGVLTVHLIYLGVRRFAPDWPSLAAGTASLALTPQFLHVSASVSNDPLTNLAGAFLFWRMGVLHADPARTRPLPESLLAFCLPALTKLTLLPMALTYVAAALWHARGGWRAGWRRRALLAGALGAALAAAAAALEAAMPGFFDGIAEDLVRRSTRLQDDALVSWSSKLLWLARSYWGLVGWASVSLTDLTVVCLSFGALLGAFASLRLLAPPSAGGTRWRTPLFAAQIALAVLVLLSRTWTAVAIAVALAWLLYKWFQWPNEIVRSEGAVSSLPMLWIAVALAAVVVGRNALASGHLQGRFLFPVLGPISLLVAAGWSVILPRGASRHFGVIAGALLVWLNVWLWVEKIVPVYFQPFLD